jgi:hypothetical protein
MAGEQVNVAEHLEAIRSQLAEVHQQLAAIHEQQRLLCALLGAPGPAPAEGEAGATLPGQETLADCARDLLRVLREVGRPLTMLELLDELVRRQLRWRESTVSHALVVLQDHAQVRPTGEGGSHRYEAAPV